MQFQRIFGGWTWRDGAMAGLFLSLLVAATVLLVGHLPKDDTTDFAAAAHRIDTRIQAGELVVLHPPGNAWYMDHFDRHMVLAPQKLTARDVEFATGLWFVTDRGDQRVRQVFSKAIHRFKRQGSARFGAVTVFHYWEPKSRDEK